MKNISIFGSTGSIGCNTLKVVKNLNNNGYPIRVKYLTGNSNTELIASQIEEFKPKAAAIFNEESYKKLKSRSLNTHCELFFGADGLKEIAGRDDYELAVNALVGFSGLVPTVEAIKHGKDIALANKESLVVAGELITGLLGKTNSKLLPIDSEHSAILQCIQGEPFNKISKIILTASGGPFRSKSREEMQNVT